MIIGIIHQILIVLTDDHGIDSRKLLLLKKLEVQVDYSDMVG